MPVKAILKRMRIDGIWHFTDQANIDLITEQGGLLSLNQLENRQIKIPIPGGNEWSHEADKRKKLDKYVHLAFIDDHPMLYVSKQEGRLKNPLWLKIGISVLANSRVLFSTDVSNKRGVDIIDAEKAATEIDFEVLFTYMNWRDPEIQARRQAAIKSEILIPDFVPIDYILGYKNG